MVVGPLIQQPKVRLGIARGDVQTVYLGTLGLVLVLPMVGGAYLGHWLDGLRPGYSMRWTLGLLFLGLVVGVFNVYFLIRGRE